MTITKAVLRGKRSLCRACGECFSTTSNFDRHRKGVHGVDRHCVSPDSAGMVVGTVGESTFWKMPGEATDAML